MLDKLIPLLGKSLDNQEIKALFAEWGVDLPSKITCTANNDTVKTKMKKDGLILSFGRGANSRYMKPIEAAKKGSYIGLFKMIEVTPTYRGALPFPISTAVNPDELTAAFGTPKVVDFMGKTTTWRKVFQEKYELVASISEYTDGSILKSMYISFIYEPDLYTMEEYAAKGF
jgi:hypothetical protein